MPRPAQPQLCLGHANKSNFHSFYGFRTVDSWTATGRTLGGPFFHPFGLALGTLGCSLNQCDFFRNTGAGPVEVRVEVRILTLSVSAKAVTDSSAEPGSRLDHGTLLDRHRLASSRGSCMPKRPSRTADHDLVRDLSHLRDEEGLTLARIERTPALLQVCGEGADRANHAREQVINALGSMQDSDGGRALKYMYNLSGKHAKNQIDRRKAYAKSINKSFDTVMTLECDAIYELAIRLLGGYYQRGGARNQTSEPIPMPEYAVCSVHVACIIRDRRLIETLQKWTILPLRDAATRFEYHAAPGVKLRDVCNARAESISENDGKYAIIFARPLQRGRSYTFSFRQIVERNWSEELPATNYYRRQFDEPVLRYWVGVRFIGEQPAAVWSFTDVPSDRVPKNARKGKGVLKTDTGYEAVEFVDLYRYESGVAWSWREPRTAFIMVAVGMFVAATLNLPALVGMTGETAGAVSILLFLLLAAAGIRLTFKYFAVRNRRWFKSSHHYNEILQVPPQAAIRLRSAPFTKTVTPRQSAVLTTSILKPRQYRQRVVETHTLGRRTVSQRVTIEAQLPPDEAFDAAVPVTDQDITHASAAIARSTSNVGGTKSGSSNDGTVAVQAGGDGGRDSQPLYFPVLVPKKSNLQDNFRLFDKDGAALPCLSYREYLQLTAVVLRMILAVAFDLNDPLVRSQVLAAELKALRLILSRRTAAGEAPSMLVDDDWYRALTKLEPRDKQAWKSVLGLVRRLSSNYAIVAVVQPDSHGRIWLSYERTLIPDLRLARRDRFAVLVGARPVDLSIAVTTASTCQSYHLHVIGTEDVFLGRQYLVDSSRTLEGFAAGEIVPPHYRFRRRLGQPHAHFYTRFFPEPAEVDFDGLKRHETPQVRLKYFETPPGSLLRAAVSAVACVLLVSLVGVVSSRSLDPGTDAAAVLLVFPALAAAWLGFESPSRGLLEGTIATRLSLITTVAISLSASGLFMAHKALTKVDAGAADEVVYNWWRLPPKWSILWIHDISWIALTLFALANAIVILYFYVSRTAYFAYLAGRQDGSDLQQHG